MAIVELPLFSLTSALLPKDLCSAYRRLEGPSFILGLFQRRILRRSRSIGGNDIVVATGFGMRRECFTVFRDAGRPCATKLVGIDTCTGFIWIGHQSVLFSEMCALSAGCDRQADIASSKISFVENYGEIERDGYGMNDHAISVSATGNDDGESCRPEKQETYVAIRLVT
jgi:hypothetical protein